MSVWKSDEKLLIFASLFSPSTIIFVGEVILGIQHSVSLPHETPRRFVKNTPMCVVFPTLVLSVSTGDETLRLMLDILLDNHQDIKK